MSTRSHIIGRVGEAVAVRFLAERGCRIIGRNVRRDGGEIDVVVDDAGTIAAVEVKTTMSETDGLERVDQRKWDVVYRTGTATGPIARYDVVTVGIHHDGAIVRWLRGVE
ncbi:MAG: YraN family protein [Acidimicrobiia bacterium]|nr:YraN family protein [Acidimicrobiia bacterium]